MNNKINKVKINDIISTNVQFDATVIPLMMSKKPKKHYFLKLVFNSLL